MENYHIDNIDAFVGKQIGISDWLEIDQKRVDAFAEATNDHNPLHVDPDWARQNGPFGGPVAHGFLTLSLLSWFAYQAKLQPAGVEFGVNYGFERVRFMAPVRVGDRIRNRVVLTAADGRGEGRYVLKTQNTVEIEGGSRPALVATWLAMYMKA